MKEQRYNPGAADQVLRVSLLSALHVLSAGLLGSEVRGRATYQCTTCNGTDVGVVTTHRGSPATPPDIYNQQVN